MENKYKVYACDFEGNQVGASLFEAREVSNICSRWCLSYTKKNYTKTLLFNNLIYYSKFQPDG